MLLAFDDTDDLEGGCTTYMVFRVLLALPDLALRGMPRLVRLNPNIPYKTRGNAAVVLDLVRPEGPSTRVGELKGREILAFPDGPDPDDVDADAAWAVIQEHARPDSDPGMWVGEALPEPVYWQGVRGVLERAGIDDQRARGGRGVVGAAAAAAWPGPASSYEFIAYRHPSKWGTPRELDEESFLLLDGQNVTFHTCDGRDLVAAPATPCPVLIGLRGLEPQRLRDIAVRTLLTGAKEPVDGWLLFATNQASGDHVSPIDSATEASAYQTVALGGTVRAAPVDRPGGHVLVELLDGRGHAFSAAAFEPTGDLRKVVRQLRVGDQVTCAGAWDNGTVKLEKLEVRGLAPPAVQKQNPRCPECGTSMKSRGKDAGYRCKHGHGNAPEEAAAVTTDEPALRQGWYEVPVRARRHLHRPLAFDALPKH